MTEIKQSIPARLKNMAVGGHVAGADDIIDDVLGKELNVINLETIENINAERVRAEGAEQEIYNYIDETKEEWSDVDLRMAQMQATINAKQLEVGAVQTDEVPTENSGNHMTSGDIYQTLKNSAKGFVDDEPTAGSNNLVKSGGVQNELALGAIYDVSAKNPTAGPNNDGKWESFSALLSDANLNTLIPTVYRKGGMSIKFVQSSDNKYVQYMCKTSTWSSTSADWEKVNVVSLDDLDKISQQIYEDSSYSTSDFTNIGLLRKDGGVTTFYGTTYVYSDYIPINKVKSVSYANLFSESSGQGKQGVCGLCIYDSSKEFVSYKGDGTGSYDVQEGDAYIRVSCDASNDASLILYNDNTIMFKSTIGSYLYKYLKSNNVPYLRFDKVDSSCFVSNKEGIGTRDGIFKLLIRVPDDIQSNQLLIHYPDTLMVAIYNGNLFFYNYTVVNIGTISLESYRNKLTTFLFIKNNGNLIIKINDVVVCDKKYTPSVSTPTNDFSVFRNYTVLAQRVYADFYYLQMFDLSYNLLWEINAYNADDAILTNVDIYMGTSCIKEYEIEERDYVTADCRVTGILLKGGDISTAYGDTYVTSDFISLNGYKKIVFENLFPEASGDNTPVGLVIYDSNESAVRAIGDGTGETLIQSGEVYVRFTPLNKTLNNAKLSLKVSSSVESQASLQLLPEHLYLTPNKEYNIYLENLIIGAESQGYQVNVYGTGVKTIKAQNRNVRLNISNTGTYNTTWDLFDAYGNLIDSKLVTIHVASASAGNGVKNVLFIGDSTIDKATPGVYEHEGPEIVMEFYTMCMNNLGFTPILLGKETYVKDGTTYRHEGHTGQASTYFIGSSSPFYYNGSLDFSAYMEEMATLIPDLSDTIDYVVFQIGINDLKNSNGSPTQVIQNVKTLIDAVHADYPNAKFIVGVPASGNDANGFSTSFNGNTTTLQEFIPFRKRMIDYIGLIFENFDNDSYGNNVLVGIAGEMIDRIYGFPYATEDVSARSNAQVMTHTDSVHPNKSGYGQMADAYFGLVKNLASN